MREFTGGLGSSTHAFTLYRSVSSEDCVEFTAPSGIAGELTGVKSLEEHAICKTKITKKGIVRLIVSNLTLDCFIKVFDSENLLIFPPVNADCIIA